MPDNLCQDGTLHSSFRILPSSFPFALLAAITIFTATPHAPAQTDFGSALQFDGVNDYVNVSASMSGMTTQYTLEVWVRPASFNWLGGLISKYHSVNGHGFVLRLSSVSPYSGINFDEMSTTNGILALGSWQHVAAVNDNGTRHLYLNGVEQALSGTPQTVVNNSDPITLGVDYLTLPRYLSGQMDEVRIWNVARNQADIQANMNHTLAGTEFGLVAYWRFDEGTGSTTVDDTGHAYTGTLVNGPTWVCGCGAAPAIITQPVNQRMPAGGTATFSVAASGAAPLSYFWRRNSTPIAGATQSTYTTNNVQMADSGSLFSCLVSNACGTILSSSAVLTVYCASVLFDDFEPGIDLSQWTAFSGTVLATNYGGSLSGVNSLWFGGDGSRYAVSRALNTAGGGAVDFYLRIADGSSYPWEMADLPGEGIVLEYSTNGGSAWVEMGRYDTAAYFNWTHLSVSVPVAAQTASTQFRWRQLSNSGASYDHWALDDVAVITIPQLALTCPSNLVVTAGAGQCAAIATFTVSATDNCDPSPTVACVPPSGSSFPMGSTTVLCTAWDASGNTNTCTFAVMVRDATQPILACPTNLVITAASGQCAATATFSATATDACDPNPVVTCVPPSGSSFPVGRTTVVCTAWDIKGNTNTCSFTVSVYPYGGLGPVGQTWMATSAPRTNWASVASSSDGTRLVAVAGFPGPAGLIYTSTDAGANWTATSAPSTNWSGVASSADGVKLVAVALNARIYISANGGTSWSPRPNTLGNWSCVASSTNGTKLVAAVQNGQIYTSVNSGLIWTARDASRFWASVASSADGSKLVAVDNFGSDLLGGQIYTSINSGTNWTARDTARLWSCVASSADGTNLVAAEQGGQIYTSTDSGTNWTAQATFVGWACVASSADGSKLVAADRAGPLYTSVPMPVPLINPPTILGATNQVVEANALGGAVGPFGITATNLCQTNVPVSFTPSLVPLGTHTVICLAVDLLGATNTATFTLTVRDTTPPVLTLQGANPFVLRAGSTFTDPGATATDVCAGVLTASIVVNNNVNTIVLGTYTNTYTVTDPSDNMAHTNRTIIVRDATPPVCPTQVVLAALPGQCAAALAVTVTDAYDPAPGVACVPPLGTFLPVGRTNIVCTVWDVSGNTNTCSVAISVYPCGGLGAAGETWVPRETNRNWWSVASSADGTKLVAGVLNGPIYTSTDSGVTWIARGISGNWHTIASSADGARLIAADHSGLLYTSTDSGATWTGRAFNADWEGVASSADGTKLLAVDFYGYWTCWTSTDSGTNWTENWAGYNTHWTGAASSADGTHLIACPASDGDYFLVTSSDSGATWTPRDASRAWYAVASSADGAKLAAVVYGGQIYVSADFGVTWTPTGSVQAYGSVASSVDGARLIAGSRSGQLQVSTDSGLTWTPRGSSNTWAGVASSADGNKLVAVVNGGQIYTSVGTSLLLTNPPTILGATNLVVGSTGPGSGTTTYDSTTDHLDGTLVNGPTRVASALPFGGYALAFDGVDDLVQIPGFGAQMPTSEVTVEFWQRVNSAKTQSTFCLNPDNTANRFNAHVPWGSGVVYWDFGNINNGGRLAYTPTNSIVGTWQHFAFVSSGSGNHMLIYRNGVLEASKSGTSTFSHGQYDLTLGWNQSNNGFFDGDLDEVRIWNVERSAGQIQAGMNQPLSGTEPGLVAYYRFDEGAVPAAFSVTAANTCQPNVPVTCTPPSGSEFPLGTNTVACMAVDAFGVTNTASFTVTVLDVRPPAIVTQAAGQVVRPGTNVTFCATATGAAPLSYQWRKDGTSLVDGGRISGATNACLTITSIVQGDSGDYSLAVTNASGATNSAKATLWVTALDHFAWGPIATPQVAGAPFPVTLTAQDALNNVDTYFAGMVTLSGSAGGLTTNFILGSPADSDSFSVDGGWTAAYAFTPNTNLTVTHVRHYFGSKVSIWTEGGMLLAAQNVVSVPGSWVETPLTSPIQLTNGARYRVGAYFANANVYGRYDMAGVFPYGTIDASCEASGDAFPANSDSGRWWFVDLRYTVGAALAVAIAPTQSLNFTNGVWSGPITVLQPATNAVLAAAHSTGPRGASNPFDVRFRPPPPLFGGCCVTAPGQFRLQATGTAGLSYTVQTSTNLVDWVTYTNLVASPTGLIECLEDMDTDTPTCFYRLKWP